MNRAIVVTLLLLAGQAPAASRGSVAAIEPSDENILYAGRWYRADPSAPWCSWQCCSIIARFRGTSISARFGAVADGRDWVFVIIDDDRLAKILGHVHCADRRPEACLPDIPLKASKFPRAKP